MGCSFRSERMNWGPAQESGSSHQYLKERLKDRKSSRNADEKSVEGRIDMAWRRRRKEKGGSLKLAE